MVTVGVLIISDSVYKRERKDLSEKAIGSLLARLPDVGTVSSMTIPDEQDDIAKVLRAWSDKERLNLILTTGGTGLAPRDVTPEATKAVIEREVPGIAEALRSISLQYTAMAMLSRGVAGVRGRTLIINLPGSPKAVTECLEYVLPVLPHAINLLTEGPKEH